MGRKFGSASERVSVLEDDFIGVCQVLAGSSRWQKFIGPNVDPAIKKYPCKTFNIVSAETFGRRGGLDSETMALTDKIAPEMVFVEINKGGAETLAVSALHELVHWVSHPPQQGHRITAWGFLDDGLGEGLTHVVTEDIFEDQGIKQYYKPVYSERVAVVRKLIERFDVGPFGEALFGGTVKSLQPLLDAYGSEGVRQIKALATANNSMKAIEYIDCKAGAR
jgi:hypothetical protein